MKKIVSLFIILILVLVAFVKTYTYFHGFTSWMTYAEMEDFFEPLNFKDENGKNFWDHRHWLTGVECRWHDGQPQIRLRIESVQKKGPYTWYWWFNQDQVTMNKRIHEYADQDFKLVYFDSFQWPDGSTRYSGIWQRYGKAKGSSLIKPTAESQEFTANIKNNPVIISLFTDKERFIGYKNLTGYAIKFEKNSEQKFKIVDGLADPTCVSLESIDMPGYYFRHQSYEIKLQPFPPNDDLFKLDSTFRLIKTESGVIFQSYNLPSCTITATKDNVLYMARNPDLNRNIFNIVK